MFKRIIDFLKSRPTEVWLGLWTAVVAFLTANNGIELSEGTVAAVAAIVGWVVTFLTARSSSFGPK